MYSLLMAMTFAGMVLANVEKTIFIAPESIPVPAQQPNLDDLGLERLSPALPSIRTHLDASFPSEVAPEGAESWVLLEDLNPGQRYEVRICWLATQPTSFSLSTFTLPETFDNPPLISSLSAFSYDRLARLERQFGESMPTRPPYEMSARNSESEPQPESILFLQILTAADYFTVDKGLMENPPHVEVDIILDPFLLNIFPRSLVPTAVYILIIAVCAWFISQLIWGGLATIAQSSKRTNSGKISSEKKKGKMT